MCCLGWEDTGSNGRTISVDIGHEIVLTCAPAFVQVFLCVDGACVCLCWSYCVVVLVCGVDRIVVLCVFVCLCVN